MSSPAPAMNYPTSSHTIAETIDLDRQLGRYHTGADIGLTPVANGNLTEKIT